MTHNDAERAASLLHLHRETLSKGDPVPPQITLAAMYHLPGDPAGVRTYGRADNPNWEVLEQALSHLEGAETVVFPSGMAAIAAPLFALLAAGDRILIPSDGYYTTRLLADRYLKRLGVTVETRPTAEMEEGGFHGYRLVFLETPSNPGLDLCDLAAITAAVRAAGGLTVVDNTTMTPFGQRPLDLGADIVVAADTKAPNGHSDVLTGHVASRDGEVIAAVREWRKLSGSIPGPFECWLAHRGLETLELRFDRMCSSAATLAPRLAEHPAIGAIRYPGLDTDPSHGLAQRQMTRPGFLIGLTLPSAEAAETFINNCPLLQPATSFGGVHSSAERRIRWGDAVDPGFVRLSVGCEPVEELWNALKASLDACV
ncbi:cystathionine gamma-lyase [Defluviimonas aestuarii]|uniref:cystathionine gamma-lyase n=1 Tax=Albidovulum aestuarii TaxID=1130726 RepID=UPI00249CBD3B|nr:cystathionine gamma-lyase [Defluviimonas aestuarii]MDI3338124.1 cystathionine gamma-lyase [Defluviimonas aestuarii]